MLGDQASPSQAVPSSSPVIRTLSPKASGRTSSGFLRRAQQGGHPGLASQPLDPSRPPRFAG
ncbi:uncharacterized protein SCHCODRAFT_02608488 [Schizophyllum commune H4-8]|uniref:Expressed protein n=1 Tax=Schizophyllum commune (strain H4-8 / FGSC 9210) TaxID=578458 RepID=D8PUJ0_SCHCM|nr:uncharacterized protein SCHCODRAFT_02608488 [Schizophyllum commune H4-8]KAI5900653.1 hypothetical protein SCHCODRAFT_02608488 [Schizophyllum commune H4-8]